MEHFHHVLFVDDDPFIRNIVEFSLKSDFKLTICRDGLEAITWITEGNRPDIIVTDLDMPKIGGLELIQEIRGHLTKKQVGIIILSSADDSSLRIDCIEQGVDHFVVKPFNPRELSARIKSLLR